MNTISKLNMLEKKISNIYKYEKQLIWVCICGEEPCICTEEHKQSRCKRDPSGSCIECKSSSAWRFMVGKVYSGTPIVTNEKLLLLVELVKKGEIKLPLPIFGGLSSK